MHKMTPEVTPVPQEGRLVRFITRVGERLLRFGLGGPYEIRHAHTGFLVMQVDEVTSFLEINGYLYNPPNIEVVEFARQLRNAALPAILKRGLDGLENLGPLKVPEEEAGDIIEKVLTFEHAGKHDYNHAWKTHIAQLWLTRDTTDPLNIRRTVIGTHKLNTSLKPEM